MKKSINQKNKNNNLKNNNILASLNRTYENILTEKNSKEKNSKNIMSLKSYSHNNGLLFKKFNNSSYDEKKLPLNKCHTLKKHITLKAINSKVFNYKLKLLNMSTKNKDSNKYLINCSYSHSLKKNELNNSLNYLGATNLKKNIFIFKDKKGKNNLNALSNIINLKKNSIPFKNDMLKKRKIQKMKNKSKMFNMTVEDMKSSIYSNENAFTNSIEENKDNFNSTFITDNNNKYNKFTLIQNNSKFNENHLLKYETITKDEYSLLIKKINILLEEKQIYKKKVVFLQKENQKLKEEVNSKKYRKDEINEIKSLNDELKKQNHHLKEEVNNLKSKINELIAINKKNTIKEKLLEDIPLGYFESFLSTVGGLSLPSTERYIKKLEKENDELSNELSKYKHFYLTKNNN